MCRDFMEKLEQIISQKPHGTKNRMTGKQTTITFNNSQRTKETLWLYIYTGGTGCAGFGLIASCSHVLIYKTPVIHNYLLRRSHSYEVALLTSLGE